MDVTIVHLSDLHLKNDVENRFRLERLRDDISRLQSSGPVFAAFTGDLIQAGDENNYDLLFDELIGPLVSQGHEVLVVPGNHDVQRSITSEEFANRAIRDRASSYLFDGRVVRSSHPEPDLDALKNYRSLEDLLGPYDQSNYWGYSVTKGPVSFVGLNSAWLCCKRKDDASDRGNLRVEPAVLDMLSRGVA